MSYAELRDLAMQLSDADRDRLAEELAVSVPAGVHPFARERAETVNRRIEEVEGGSVATRPFRQVIDELRTSRTNPSA